MMQSIDPLLDELALQWVELYARFASIAIAGGIGLALAALAVIVEADSRGRR